MRDNTYKCDCCGAPINPATMKCEYCGTQYQHRGGNVVRIETFRNPVHTLAVENKISMFDVKALGVEGATKAVMADMARQMAEALPAFMRIESAFDPATMYYRTRGTIKIVEPVRGNDDLFRAPI